MRRFLFILLVHTFVISNILAIETPSFYINGVHEVSIPDVSESELEAFIAGTPTNNTIEVLHTLKAVNSADRMVILTDDSKWKIGWWYRNEILKWKSGDRLKISYYGNYSNYTKIENLDTRGTAWGVLWSYPSASKGDYIKRIPNSATDPDAYRKVILNSGWVFRGGTHYVFGELGWKVKDQIIIMHCKDNYALWNTSKKQIVFNCSLIKNEKPSDTSQSSISDILSLEWRLNNRVIDQKEATQAVFTAILNYAAGCKDPKTPVGVFLFLGPTGVGKTELAKVLAQELYQDHRSIIRLDMSQYTDSSAATRLIGSPPGYVNHEEGGQLTEALKQNTETVVLLDEIEKAHPTIYKIFLPVFDEGYILDSKNERIDCKNTIFIMTSNLCSQKIVELFYQGYEADQILQTIEPQMLTSLSPEFFARTQGVLFKPLSQTALKSIVVLMLNELVTRMKETKNIDLTFNSQVYEFLETNGYSHNLGARPLKKLIQNTVVKCLSYALISQNIPDGSHVNISFDSNENSWQIDWYY